MHELRFIWDTSKNRSNKRKHGISFEEAQTVFYDENAIEFFDPEHSTEEDRFLMLGLSFKFHVLVVCHCLKDKGSAIRIISARKATQAEAKSYWRQNNEN
ncbi:MAG: BrnT family toxin [Deltaproteobacteria bacterium]|nr:BrnT family toxin [Deltaproteobacteria bacterium]